MIKLLVKLFCLLCTVQLFSCASYNTEQDISPQNDNQRNPLQLEVMPLLKVPKSLQNSVWLEKFTFSLIGKHTALANTFANESMLLQTELSAQGINLAAMSFSGALLAQASWLNSTQKVTSEIGLAKDFNARQVLHDLQITNWPLQQVEQHLFSAFTVSEQQDVDSRIRRFYHHGEVIIIIRYSILTEKQQSQYIDFQQLSQGYRLAIQRLSDDALTLKH